MPASVPLVKFVRYHTISYEADSLHNSDTHSPIEWWPKIPLQQHCNCMRLLILTNCFLIPNRFDAKPVVYWDRSGARFINSDGFRFGYEWVITPIFSYNYIVAYNDFYIFNFNVSLTKTLLKLGHGWVITTHYLIWRELLFNALIPMLVR